MFTFILDNDGTIDWSFISVECVKYNMDDMPVLSLDVLHLFNLCILLCYLIGKQFSKIAFPA